MTWKQYRCKSTKTYIAEIRDYTPGEDITFVKTFSMTTKAGDKIARHLTDNNDQWLIKKEFFDKEMEPVT